ncbi:hypothetical protein [Stomatohabitans albus]|uniref:hypothetical protein n=1 Tax=Stomatohabitans albus TaxID=3110766 RepID=UPI00300C348B
MDVLTVTLPALCTIPGVELVHVGSVWHASTGDVEITHDVIRALIQASRDPVIPRPVLKLGHVDPRFDGQPALGRLVNLRLADTGDAVVADLVGVPAWLAHVLPTAFPARSVEFQSGASTGYPGADRYPLVLTGLALLGQVWPAITVLEDVPKVLGQEVVMDKSMMAGGMPVEDISRKVADRIEGVWSWVTELLFGDDGIEAIVETDAQSLVAYPVTVEGDDVTLGDPRPVRRTYTDVEGQHLAGAGVTRLSVHVPNEPSDMDGIEDESLGNEPAGDVGSGQDSEPETVEDAEDALADLIAQVQARDAQIAVLTTEVSKLRQAQEAQRQRDHASLLAAAVRDGRITPHERDTVWADFFKAAPDQAAVHLAGLVPVVPMTEVGVSPAVEAGEDVSEQYAALKRAAGIKE